ncbi:hypothetical protein K461DRAFT_280991 [Myriangium duriaei CBS 260.36]|uniref:Uncharacterized protein n=1 Tax=Myriangium duriaei CBS 260.36 TaxID=1168546 RepID=A0A9P4MEB0_9PEZI|nr:hypothetical protein K461DRAFT_280991 [Myriangium duriaei CBS 260.36]
MVAAPTIKFTLANMSSQVLIKCGEDLICGQWEEVPPEEINAGDCLQFKAVPGNVPADGVKGTLSYTFDGGETIIMLHFGKEIDGTESFSIVVTGPRAAEVRPSCIPGTETFYPSPENRGAVGYYLTDGRG